MTFTLMYSIYLSQTAVQFQFIVNISFTKLGRTDPTVLSYCPNQARIQEFSARVGADILREAWTFFAFPPPWNFLVPLTKC